MRNAGSMQADSLPGYAGEVAVLPSCFGVPNQLEAT